MAAADSPYAIRFERTGGPEVLERQAIEPGKPGPGEVLLRQQAIGLNFIDTYFRSGLYPLPLPAIPGGEAAGVIEAVGAGVEGFRPGDRVGYCTGPPGAYASHRLVREDRLVPLPEGISAEQAAAALLKGCTAEFLIERCARVQPGQWVLVHAASGGVGSILVQWLKAIGARVIAHSGDERKAALAAGFGADHSLCCPFDALAAEVRRLTEGDGVPVAMDGVGAASWSASLASLARRGLLVSFGNASGPVQAIGLLDLMRAGSVFVTRPNLVDYCGSAKELRGSAGRLFGLMLDGAVRVEVRQRFPLEQAADAHRALESRATTGSTLLLP